MPSRDSGPSRFLLFQEAGGTVGMRSVEQMAYWGGVILLLFVCSQLGVRAAEYQHSMQLSYKTERSQLELNRQGAARDSKGRELTLTRLDLILSQVQFRSVKGNWLALPEWQGFFRASEPTRSTELPALPEGDYSSMRFSVGVPAEVNHRDPALLPAEHPLHPVTSGMHWGWATGYIFLALEGRWQQDNAPPGLLGGFSYHLGNDPQYKQIELPLSLGGRGPQTIYLSLNAGRLLQDIDVSRDGDSTHSRSQDAIVKALLAALPAAFSASVAESSATAPAREIHSPAVSSVLTPYPFQLSAQMPQLSLPADNLPTLEGVALGRALFHDKRLSRDSSISCASCHAQSAAFADGTRRFSLGVESASGKRNAMPLFNLAWASEFFWDGRAPSLRAQALMPIQDAHEMAESLPRVVKKLTEDKPLLSGFKQVFGTAEVTAERVGLVLEQFMLTLISQEAKFDRVQRGAAQFTVEEQRGFQLFLTEHDPFRGLRGADCFHCHGGPLFTNHHFMNIGLPEDGDVGRYAVTHDAADRGKFRTPSLRNIALTAPYMHDGRFQTLEEVIDHYDHGVVKGPTLDPNLAKHPSSGMKLSAQDKSDMVSFLRTLTDEAFTTPSVEGKSKVVTK